LLYLRNILGKGFHMLLELPWSHEELHLCSEFDVLLREVSNVFNPLFILRIIWIEVILLVVAVTRVSVVDQFRVNFLNRSFLISISIFLQFLNKFLMTSFRSLGQVLLSWQGFLITLLSLLL
jgi:hypothetical protein